MRMILPGSTKAMAHHLFAALCLLACLCIFSCAPRAVSENLPALERQWPARDRVFRHQVHIDFPGRGVPFSFDGVMRIAHSTGVPTATVTCLGPLGLALCAMTVTPEGHTTSYIHPGLAAVPHMEKHMALCVAGIWFAALPVSGPEKGNAPLREMFGGALLEHSMENDGGRLVRALGPEAMWTVAYTPGDPQPTRITFHNDRDGYTVRVRFVAELTEGGGGP